jgi:WD40 repeat protein
LAPFTPVTLQASSYHKSVRVWDGEQVRELQGHTHTATSVAFLPDSNQIVSASEDRSVRVWDASTGEQLRELQGHTDGWSHFCPQFTLLKLSLNYKYYFKFKES